MTERFDASEAKYESFEDPVTGENVPKSIFCDTYRVFLESLQCLVSDFYSPNPLLAGAWRFLDDDARQDFYDGCRDKGLLLELSEIHAGESKQEKDSRVEAIKAIEKQRLKMGKVKQIQK